MIPSIGKYNHLFLFIGVIKNLSISLSLYLFIYQTNMESQLMRLI